VGDTAPDVKAVTCDECQVTSIKTTTPNVQRSTLNVQRPTLNAQRPTLKSKEDDLPQIFGTQIPSQICGSRTGICLPDFLVSCFPDWF
jgi:hypothetical protein